jgi:crossover junction endodeoxyribonuclease RuvC
VLSSGSPILGVDPGTHHCGWGVVRRDGTRFVHIAHGVINAPTKDSLPLRLRFIADAMQSILLRYAPSTAGIEQAFVHMDPKAALAIGHARGAVMVECVRAGVSVNEYAPTVVKRSVVGTGRADKTQVNSMIRVLLGLSEAPPLDASDALAVAICHSSAAQFADAIEQARTPAATKSSTEPRSGTAPVSQASAALLKLWKPKRSR